MVRLAILLALCGTAVADDAGARKLVLAVDETVQRDVGFAIGLHCDDTTIVRGEMKSKSETQNVFVATGLEVGRTQCRVGTDPHRPSVLFEITVVPSKKRR